MAEIAHHDLEQVELILARWKKRTYLSTTYEYEALGDILFLAGLIKGEEISFGDRPAGARPQ